MKANQKFMEADDAVSPVIGVILMVAITVVLAAVVFVLVSDLGDTGSSPPDIAFSKDSSAGTVSVVRAESGVNWDDLDVDVTGTCTSVAPTTATQVEGGAQVATGCVSGDTVTVRHIPTNSQVYSTTF